MIDMTIVLLALATLLAMVALFVYTLPSLLPKLSIGLMYHARAIKFFLRLGALVLGWLAVSVLPGPTPTGLQIWVALIVILVIASNWLFEPVRIIVPINNPRHMAASAVPDSQLSENAQVLGVAIGSAACAWPMETLVPHHLVNDLVGNTPVLAAW
jgi:hypothetical protein